MAADARVVGPAARVEKESRAGSWPLSRSRIIVIEQGIESAAVLSLTFRAWIALGLLSKETGSVFSGKVALNHGMGAAIGLCEVTHCAGGARPDADREGEIEGCALRSLIFGAVTGLSLAAGNAEACGYDGLIAVSRRAAASAHPSSLVVAARIREKRGNRSGRCAGGNRLAHEHKSMGSAVMR